MLEEIVVRSQLCIPLLLVCFSQAASADGPLDNIPSKVRRIPPAGIAIPDTDRAELQKGVEELGKDIDALRAALKGKPALLALLPDVQIFHNAVRYALQYDEFFNV